MADIYTLGEKLLTETDLPFKRNLVLGTSQANIINCVDKPSNSNLIYDLSPELKSSGKDQVFTVSVKITADSDGGMFYFGMTSPWQAYQSHTIEKGTHVYTWNNAKWTLNTDCQQECTIDNHAGQVKIEEITINEGTTAPKWSPAPEDYAMKTDVNSLQIQIDALKSKLGG